MLSLNKIVEIIKEEIGESMIFNLQLSSNKDIINSSNKNYIINAIVENVKKLVKNKEIPIFLCSQGCNLIEKNQTTDISCIILKIYKYLQDIGYNVRILGISNNNEAKIMEIFPGANITICESIKYLSNYKISEKTFHKYYDQIELYVDRNNELDKYENFKYQLISFLISNITFRVILKDNIIYKSNISNFDCNSIINIS